MATNNAQMNARYGRPKTFKPVAVQDRLPWTPRRSDGTVQVVLMHGLIADEFVAACHDAARACPSWVPQRIDSYVPRAIRGYKVGKGWQLGDKGTSNHSWATAADLFATPADVFPPGGVWTPTNGMPPAFAQAFTARGWTWGGLWKRTDTPHLEWTKEPPGVAAALGDTAYTDWLTGMLKQGDTGAAVLDLQLGLRMLNLPTPLSAVFTPETAASVRQLQAVMGVAVDGIVGPATEGAFLVAWADQMPTPADVAARAYQVILGRPGDAGGLAWMVEQQTLDRLLPYQVARILWDSEEAQRKRMPAPTPPPAPAPDPAPTPPPAADPAPTHKQDLLAQLTAAVAQLSAIADQLED